MTKKYSEAERALSEQLDADSELVAAFEGALKEARAQFARPMPDDPEVITRSKTEVPEGYVAVSTGHIALRGDFESPRKGS